MPGKSAVSACVDRLACEAFADMRGEAADLIDRDDGLRMEGQPIKGLASSNADGWSASLTSAKQHTATVTVFGDGRLYSYDMGYTPAANKLALCDNLSCATCSGHSQRCAPRQTHCSCRGLGL